MARTSSFFRSKPVLDMARRALALLPILLVVGTIPARAEPRPDSLVEAARSNRVGLAGALERAYGSERRPLRARLLLDTRGRLMMEAWVRVVEKDEARYERWLGPLEDAGWIPARHALDDAALVEEAAALWASLEARKGILRTVLRDAVATEESTGPAELALGIAPVPSEQGGDLALLAAVDGELRHLRFEADGSTYTVGTSASEPEPVPHETRTLPPLEVPEGRWFQLEQPPSAETWQGKPLLVVVTDPG